MQTHRSKPDAVKRRHFCMAIAGLTMTGMAACQQAEPNAIKGRTMNESPKDVVYFDVTLFSYLDRPIFDVYLNGKDIGVASGQPHRGRGGLMTGVAVPLGEQVVTWRDAGTGATFKAVNLPVLRRPDRKLTYLGVHIHPDNTVELVPEPFWPEKTERGEAINRAWEQKHGK